MPIWIVEYFGQERLNFLFWIITLSTAPFWIVMIAFGHRNWAKNVCHPWLVPPLLGGLYLYCIYLLFTVTSTPNIPETTMKGIRSFWNHPFLFMALWSHRMILDLFCGMILNRTNEGSGRSGKLSLLLIWTLGPIGIMVFALRYWMNVSERLSSKKPTK